MPLKTIIEYRRLMRNQWLNRQKVQQIQEKKLRYVVNHAFATVPFYRNLYIDAGISPTHIETIEDLSKIPVIDKSTLQSTANNQIISSSYVGRELKSEHTSGSTGQPFSVHFDPGFVTIRNLLFLRALRSCGYFFGRRILLITDMRHKRVQNVMPGWHYASLLDPPEHHLKLLNRVKPFILYGCKTTLKLLAEHIESKGVFF